MSNMEKERQELLNAFAKIPGLKGLKIPVEKLPDAAEFDTLNAQLDAIDAEFDTLFKATCESGLGFIPEDLAEVASRHPGIAQASAIASSSRSESITIRIPANVLAAIKAKAKETCTPYQTLISRRLRLMIA